MVGGVYTQLDDIFASQHQSMDWTQQATCKLQTAFSWGNRLVPGTIHETTSQEASLDLGSCFDHHIGLISRS